MGIEKKKSKIQEKLDYLNRLSAVRAKLPQQYKKEFFKMFPKFNTADGTTLLSNVMIARTINIEILEALEEYANNTNK